MLVCSFQLADIAEGDGGFGVVPGSHKSNFQPPPEIVRSPTRDSGTEREGQRGDGIHLPVINPAAPIGSMLIFLEATFHCTLPWTNHDHARRSLLYRYSPKYLHYAGELFGSSQPAWVSELTEGNNTSNLLSLQLLVLARSFLTGCSVLQSSRRCWSPRGSAGRSWMTRVLSRGRCR